MKQVASAMVKAQKAFGPALKSSSNPFFKTKYADLAACVEAVITGLNDNGIALMQICHECNDGVIVETMFVHESGETISAGKLHVPAPKQDPQGYGSALTYARRYSLMAACGIAPEDDDGNAASKEAKPKQKEDKPQKEPPPPKSPKPEAPAEAATEKQRAALWAMGIKRWKDDKQDGKERASAFMTWLKGVPVPPLEYFTKAYASECIDDFEQRAADFEAV